jgi:hypothetical protein
MIMISNQASKQPQIILYDQKIKILIISKQLDKTVPIWITQLYRDDRHQQPKKQITNNS